MMRVFLTIGILFCLLDARAQGDYSLLYTPYSGTYITQKLPSRLGMDRDRYDINFLHSHTWLGNNSFGYRDIKKLATSEEINQQQFEQDVLGNIDDVFDFYTGTELNLLNFSFSIRDQDLNELFTLGFGHRERVNLRFQLNENVLKLINQGNKQWAGQTVELGPIRTNGLYHREFFMAAAAPYDFDIDDHKLTVRAGLVLKYLTGIAGFDTEKGSVSMYTEPEGRFLQFNYQYRFNYTYPEETSNYLSGTGNGWGLDGGLSFILDDRFSLDLAVVDNGKINIKRSHRNYIQEGEHTFEGVEFVISDQNGDPSLDLEYADNVLDAQEKEEPFSMGLGRVWIANVSGGFNRVFDCGKRQVDYFKHTVSLSFIKGSNDYLNSFKAPRFQAAYRFNLKDIFQVGAAIAHDKYNPLAFGPFISLRGGPFAITIGSNDITGFVPGLGTSVDGYFRMGLFF